MKRLLIEIAISLIGIIPGIYLYKQPSSEQFSILVGLLIYIVVKVIQIDWKTTNLITATSNEKELDSLNKHLRSAKQLGEPVHVYLDWALGEMDNLERRYSEIAEKSFTVRDSDQIEMDKLYKYAYKFPEKFYATCPEQAVNYLISESGRAFLNKLWGFNKIENVCRLIILDGEAMEPQRLEAIKEFHRCAGWSLKQITHSRYKTVRAQAAGAPRTESNDNFSIFGSTVVCKTVRQLENRMMVVFTSDESQIVAYRKLFDELWNNATPLTESQRLNDADFNTAFEALKDGLAN